jgi:hypothetical protein
VAREQSAAASRDIVNEKRRARYEASASGKGAAQLTAEIEALKQDPRWTTSKQCIEATAPASRTYCQDYYRKVADLAAAKEAANLEQTVWNTSVETADLPRNLAKGALWVSDVTGMSVRAATNILVALMVCFIQAGLAFSLRIGWAPEKPREALQPAKSTEATETPAVATPAIYDAPAQDDALSPERLAKAEKWVAELRKAHEKMRAANVGPDHVPDPTKMVPEQIAETAKFPTLSNVENEPNHPEIPVSSEASGEIIPLALAGDEPTFEDVIETAGNVTRLFAEMPKPLVAEHPFGADVKIRRRDENTVTRWLRDRTRMTNGKGSQSRDLYPDYTAYCFDRKEAALSKKKFATLLRGELDLPKLRDEDGKRSGAVIMFPIELAPLTMRKTA